MCIQHSKENKRRLDLGHSREVSFSSQQEYLINGIFTMKYETGSSIKILAPAAISCLDGSMK